MKKRLLQILFLCLPLAVLLTVGAAAEVVDSGECGANGSSVQWSLDNDGNLSITGNGTMRDYNRWWNGNNPFPLKPAWNGYSNMVTSLTVADGVTGIGAYAFARLNRLMTVTFPDSISSIEDYTFYECSNLLSFAISDNVTSIGDCAFYECDRLTEILIPASVINIGENAFSKCDVLQKVTILADIPMIKASTFADCSVLKEITIPDSVAIIGKNAFSGCAALKTVNFIGSESLWNDVTINSGNQPLENATVNFDTSVESTYRINALSVTDADGNPLTAIPKSPFLVTISVKNRASGATPVILLASYSENGQYQGLMYVTVREPVGGTVDITLPVDNSSGNIAQLKAFGITSFANMGIIGKSVNFPA